MNEPMSYFRTSFAFFSAHHADPVNRAIHIVAVPCIFATALTLLHSLLPSLWGYSAADVVAVVFALSYLALEPLAAVLYLPVMYALHHFGTVVLGDDPATAVALQLGMWGLQTIGHAVFERSVPPLGNFAAAMHLELFFVWLEALFAVGYKPLLAMELHTSAAKRTPERGD